MAAGSDGRVNKRPLAQDLGDRARGHHAGSVRASSRGLICTKEVGGRLMGWVCRVGSLLFWINPSAIALAAWRCSPRSFRASSCAQGIDLAARLHSNGRCRSRRIRGMAANQIRQRYSRDSNSDRSSLAFGFRLRCAATLSRRFAKWIGLELGRPGRWEAAGRARHDARWHAATVTKDLTCCTII